eukprot:scaffold14742_cov114-Isochrysis_galbana.AAC.4
MPAPGTSALPPVPSSFPLSLPPALTTLRISARARPDLTIRSQSGSGVTESEVKIWTRSPLRNVV